MTTPDDATPDDLVEPEGVDAGSAASVAEGEAPGAAANAARSLGTGTDATAASAEGDAGPEADRDLLGPPASALDAEDGATRAYPDDVHTPEERSGPGQQVQVGEG